MQFQAHYKYLFDNIVAIASFIKISFISSHEVHSNFKYNICFLFIAGRKYKIGEAFNSKKKKKNVVPYAVWL